jgi:ATP-binding cassette, subfamily F, member 3
METIELKPLPTTAVIRIPPPTHVGKSVLKLSQASFAYGNRNVLNDVNIDIQRGDHAAVVGLNGAGKSTLLKGIAGTLSAKSGLREVGYQVKVGIFNQHVIEVLKPEYTVLESLQSMAHPDVGRQDILDMAGSLLFSGEQIRKKVQVLSGGEKSRVALGQILLQKVPCLLLDEPTNHLDFQTVEALTQALTRYEGTFIVVSHDRGFIRRISTKILEVSNKQVLLYPGTYDEYIWSLQRRLANIEPEETESVPQKSSAPKVDERQQKKEIEKKVRSLEKQIRDCEQSLHKYESDNHALNEQIIAAAGNSKELVDQMSANTLEIQKCESLWIQLSEELQQVQK